MANKNKKRTSKKEELISKWIERLSLAQDNQKKVFEKAKEKYEVYYAITNDEQRANAPWRSNIFLPLLPGKARDAEAKLSVIEPRFRVVPADAWKFDNDSGELSFDEEALTKAMKISKKLNKEFLSYSPEGDLPPRVALDYSVTDALIAGWGLALAPLEVYRNTYTTKSPLLDKEGASTAYVDTDGPTQVKEILRTRTDLVPLDIFKVFISPRAKSWEHPYWVIIEREDSYKGLMKANSGKGEQVYNLPVALKDAKGTAEVSDFSAVREAVLGFAEDGSDAKDETLDMFKIYDCYDEETGEILTFVVASIEGAHKNWSIIRHLDKNPYNHGLVPIVPIYTKRRPHSPWGESFFSISMDIQHAYNASYNQFTDNATLSGESMMLTDKNSIVEGQRIAPGASILYDSLSGEKPEPWKFADPNPMVLRTRMELLEKNAEYGMMPQYSSGQVDSSMDKTTGTRGGIEMLMEAANDRLSKMLRNIKSSLLRYGYICLRNAQQFQNYIEVLDSAETITREFKELNAGGKVVADYLLPIELQDAYDLDIDDESMLPLSRSEKRRVFLDYVNVLASFQKTSIQQAELFSTPEDLLRIDWADVSKELGNQFGEVNGPAFIKEPLTKEDIIAQQQQEEVGKQEGLNMATQAAQASNPEAEVSQDTQGIKVQRQKRELSNFKDYPADVKNAVLESFGYPASQLVDTQAQAQLAEAKATIMDTEVKEQMAEAARNGQLSPEVLSKFIKR